MTSSNFEALLESGPVVINLGVQSFAESIAQQGAPAVHVDDWLPPAGGDEEMADLLDQLL